MSIESTKDEQRDSVAVQRLVRALKNARSRALYWSGNPTFTGKRFDPNARRRVCGGHDEQYELAMCDIDSLCSELEKLTGRKWKRSDTKQAFQHRFLDAMARRSNDKLTHGGPTNEH